MTHWDRLGRAGPWLEDFQRPVLETSEAGENESRSREGRAWRAIEVCLRHRVSMPRGVQAESTSLHHSPFPFCFLFPESHGQVSKWLLFSDTNPHPPNLEGKTFLRSRRSEEDGERAFLSKDCWTLGCLASRPDIGGDGIGRGFQPPRSSESGTPFPGGYSWKAATSQISPSQRFVPSGSEPLVLGPNCHQERIVLKTKCMILWVACGGAPLSLWIQHNIGVVVFSECFSPIAPSGEAKQSIDHKHKNNPMGYRRYEEATV